jgi:hypothetical protein
MHWYPASAPAKRRGDILQDRLENMGAVVDAEVVAGKLNWSRFPKAPMPSLTAAAAEPAFKWTSRDILGRDTPVSKRARATHLADRAAGRSWYYPTRSCRSRLPIMLAVKLVKNFVPFGNRNRAAVARLNVAQHAT